MKPTKLFILSAAFGTLLATPVLADFVRLGSVDIGFRLDKENSWTQFGGGMEGLRLEADRSDVRCRSIVVQFGDGTRQTVFTGQLQDNRPVMVDLRGGTRKVRDITFTCRSEERSGAKIFVAADIGRFRDEWQRSPGGTSAWSFLFKNSPAALGGTDANYWVSIGRGRFQGGRDRENIAAGSAGRSIERIGLRALDNDARCNQVRARFGNGHSADLMVDKLPKGRLVVVDLPGGNRTVTNLSLDCSAVDKSGVTIELFVRK